MRPHLQLGPVDLPVGPLQLEVGPLVLYEVQHAGHCVIHLVDVAVVALLAKTAAGLLLLLARLAAVVPLFRVHCRQTKRRQWAPHLNAIAPPNARAHTHTYTHTHAPTTITTVPPHATKTLMLLCPMYCYTYIFIIYYGQMGLLIVP